MNLLLPMLETRENCTSAKTTTSEWDLWSECKSGYRSIALMMIFMCNQSTCSKTWTVQIYIAQPLQESNDVNQWLMLVKFDACQICDTDNTRSMLRRLFHTGFDTCATAYRLINEALLPGTCQEYAPKDSTGSNGRHWTLEHLNRRAKLNTWTDEPNDKWLTRSS